MEMNSFYELTETENTEAMKAAIVAAELAFGDWSPGDDLVVGVKAVLAAMVAARASVHESDKRILAKHGARRTDLWCSDAGIVASMLAGKLVGVSAKNMAGRITGEELFVIFGRAFMAISSATLLRQAIDKDDDGGGPHDHLADETIIAIDSVEPDSKE
jgi:hypothetical protein